LLALTTCKLHAAAQYKYKYCTGQVYWTGTAFGPLFK